MALTRLSPSDVQRITLQALQVDGKASGDLASVPSLAAALRRAAAFMCPCPPRSLTRAVATGLRGLVPPERPLEEQIEEVLGSLIAYGDVLELWIEDEPGGMRRRLLYAAPPAFARHPSGVLYLVGLAADESVKLPEQLYGLVEANGVARRIKAPTEGAVDALRALGFVELPDSIWLWCPEPETASRHVERYNRLLDQASPVTSDPTLEILDPERPVRYYQGRWTAPRSIHTGRYVARRPQTYGAPLWSFVELEAGRPTRLIDLPAFGKHIPAEVRPYCRACDQAWQLQAAIDAERGEAAWFRRRSDASGNMLIDLVAPPPAWLERRWTVLGRRAPRSKGALVSFELPDAVADHEISFASNRLWLTPAPDA